MDSLSSETGGDARGDHLEKDRRAVVDPPQRGEAVFGSQRPAPAAIRWAKQPRARRPRSRKGRIASPEVPLAITSARARGRAAQVGGLVHRGRRAAAQEDTRGGPPAALRDP